MPIFPRTSERRVLPIVGVCKISSHLHILTSSHLLILTSSHFVIFTSSHFPISSSSHFFILTSVHFHIFTSSHPRILTSSHLHIFTSSHPHIFSSSHFLSCLLALLPSCSLFFSIFLLKARGSANETARNTTLSHKMWFDRHKLT